MHISRYFRKVSLVLTCTAYLHAGHLHAQVFPADSIFSIIRQHNAYSLGADWTAIGEVYRSALRAAALREDSIEAVVQVFAAMDDVHSTLEVDGKTYGYYHVSSQAEYEKIQPLLQQQQAARGMVWDTVFPDGVGYIRIPTLFVWGDDVNTVGRDIQDRLCAMMDKRLKGCIVDLRLNGGGNMYPMLAGLYPLLGDATVLHTTYPDSSVQFSWILRKGNLYAANATGDRTNITHIATTCKPEEKMAVMVLVGPVTMSSGQACGVAFRKRNNTLFIGEPTAEGYITAKNYFPVGEGIALNMSAGFISDRDGELYPRVLLPQLWVIGGDRFDDLGQDLKVQMARNRLLQH